MAAHRQTRNAALIGARATEQICLEGVEAMWKFCMGDCLDDDGDPVGGVGCSARRLACNIARGIQENTCLTLRLTLEATIEANFHVAGASARKLNAGSFEDSCPPGWEPFSRRWSDVNCN